MNINEKIKLLKDAVLLLHPVLDAVYLDVEEVAEGFCVQICAENEDPMFMCKGTEFEQTIDQGLTEIQTQVDVRTKASADVARRLELYRHPPVEKADTAEGPQKESKHR